MKAKNKTSGMMRKEKSTLFSAPAIILLIGLLFPLNLLCGPSSGLSTGFSSANLADDGNFIRQQVDNWLRQLPAQNQAEAERIFSEMIKAGSPAVEELGRRLAVPDEADDSLVRYAIDGLVRQAGKPGFENYKGRLAEDLLKFAALPIHDEIKKFLLEEVQYVAGKNQLKLLATHLKNPQLSEYAVKAMLRVRGPELEKLLVDSLDRIPPEAKGPVIQALGTMRSKLAVNKLKLLARSEDPEVRCLALTALVETAEPSVEPLLASVPTLSSREEIRKMVELYLRFARRLSESGQKEMAQRLAEKSLYALTAKDDVSLRCEALSLLVEIAKEKSVPEIIKAIWSEEPSLRQCGLNLAQNYRWPEMIEFLSQNLGGLQPEKRAQVIEFLGNTGDSAKTMIIAPYLEDSEETVRLAAIRGFYKLNKLEAPKRLLPMLNNSEAEATLIMELLQALPPEGYVGRILEIYPQLGDSIKVVVLPSLQDFITPQWKSSILAGIESENSKLKKAAVDSLAPVVDRTDLAWIIDKLTGLDDPALVSGYQRAVIAAVNQIPEAGLKQKTYLEFLEKKTGKARAELIKLLPQVGGSECLKKAVDLLNDKNPEISSAAVAAITGWPELEAAPIMVNLIKTSTDRKYRYLAFQGVARLVRESASDKEEKLRVLQEIKPLAIYPDEKNFLLTAWAGIRDVRALVELSNFLADENLKDRALILACRLARPVAEEEGLKGFETIMVLKKVLPLLKDNLEIEETEIYLDKLLRQQGFEPLFNRKDLYDWKGLVADPVGRARMTPKELTAEQKKADEEMRQHWRVVDGLLVFDGKGHNLCTVKDYCDFELFVDWKIEPGGDSGIYLRGSPQVQIWDPAQWPEGSGGLYNNQKNPNKPLKCADNPVGTWNTFYIKMVGEKVTVYLNGELVVDEVVMENYWERDKSIDRCGQIELQAHNTPLYFKNIYIREIK